MSARAPSLGRTRRTRIRQSARDVPPQVAEYDLYQAAVAQMRSGPGALPTGAVRVAKPDEQLVVTDADLAQTQAAVDQISSQLAALPDEQKAYVARSRKWRAFLRARVGQVFSPNVKSSAAIHLLMQARRVSSLVLPCSRARLADPVLARPLRYVAQRGGLRSRTCHRARAGVHSAAVCAEHGGRAFLRAPSFRARGLLDAELQLRDGRR